MQRIASFEQVIFELLGCIIESRWMFETEVPLSIISHQYWSHHKTAGYLLKDTENIIKEKN